MKILILPSAYPNSYNPFSGIFYRDHALALQTAGHVVIVLAVVGISLKAVWDQRRLPRFGFIWQDDNGIDTYLYEFPSIPKLGWLNNMIRLLMGWHLYCIIRQQHGCPNLVHVHSYTAGDLARKIKKRDAVPYVITEHSSAFARGLLSITEQRMATRVFNEAIVRTAVSLDFGRLLTKQFARPFLFTPNPIGLTNTERDADKCIIKTDRKKICICNVAFINVIKRQDRLIRAFNSVVKVFPDTELHIVGNGPEFVNLKKLVSELDLKSQVVFHGALQRQDAFGLMRSCDIFALSSDYETFGVVLIEAMSCGLPIVATRCGGPESIVNEEWLGILTRKDDESFTRGLLDIVRGVQANCFDSRRISAHAQNMYSCEAIGKLMTDIYSSIRIN